MDARKSAICQSYTVNTFSGQILSKKIKNVSLSWILVPRLIQLCRIQWSCSLFLFLFSTGNTFFEQNWSKKSKLSIFSWNSVSRLIRICIRNGDVHFLCFQPKIPFWVNLVQKIKIVSLIWNLVCRINRMCRIQWWYLLFFVLNWKLGPKI